MNCLILNLFLFVTINLINCDNNDVTSEKSNDLKEKNWQMYEMSPRNNKEHCTNKISRTQLWSSYYNCLSRRSKNVESGIPNMIVRAYVGSVTRLPCHLCVSPIEKMQVVWMYAESIYNLTFIVVEEGETAVINEELSLYYTRLEDEGVYQCKVGNSYGGSVLLEVTDEEKYSGVKPLSSHGPHPLPPEALNNNLIIFTSWSPWSECSRCDKVGRRRRYGICFVSLIDHKRSNQTENLKRTLNDEIFKLLNAHPKGIPCRSQMLPPPIGDLPGVQSRQNEIMIGLCKVTCKDGIFEIRSDHGDILERANNSAGIYSLCQNRPVPPPQIARETMFVLPGDKIFIRCPGTILRDIPATWRIGNKLVVPRQLDATTGGRVHLNARDHIVFNHVEHADTNVYSCWQDDILAGVVKLEMSQSAEDTYRTRSSLVAVIIALIVLLRYTRHLLRYRRRKSCLD